MKLIRELYQPRVAMLPIGGHYTMGPKEAALAVSFSLQKSSCRCTSAPSRHSPAHPEQLAELVEPVESCELDARRRILSLSDLTFLNRSLCFLIYWSRVCRIALGDGRMPPSSGGFGSPRRGV